jgi:hypothetical protein
MEWNILEYNTATILVALLLIVNFILMICVCELGWSMPVDDGYGWNMS